ncbi:uncharacterized protein LOC135391291 [Ornithodoros turicata]|uniref:uncharacterized protein LOC135391291 n=1 Tax=Ornithodoros turicata TaxID=34597 RepID=UPI00313A2316
MEDPSADSSTGTPSSLQGNAEYGASEKQFISEASDSLSNCLCSKPSDYLAAPLSNDRLVDHDPFQDGESLDNAVGTEEEEWRWLDQAVCLPVSSSVLLEPAPTFSANASSPSNAAITQSARRTRLAVTSQRNSPLSTAQKKVDEMKRRTDYLANMGLVFELKGASEDEYFEDKEARENVLNLFVEKDLPSGILDDDTGKEAAPALPKGIAVLDPETLINTEREARAASATTHNMLMTDQELESLSARGLDFSPQAAAATTKDVPVNEVTDGDDDANVVNSDTTASTTAAVPITFDKASNAIRVVVTTASGEQQVLQVSAQSVLQCGASVPLESLLSSAILLNPTELQKSAAEPASASEDVSAVAAITEDNVESDEPAVLQAQLPSSLLPSSSSRKVFQCGLPDCGQVFDKGCKLRVHLMSHTTCRPFKCTEENCEWSFATVYKLRRHLKTHAGKKEFMCEVEGCGRSFTTVYNLKSHRNLHKRPQFTCPAPDCRASFANRRRMQLHLREHGEIDAPFKCPEASCGKSYYSANTLASHVRGHHNKEEDLRCPFEGCGRVFDRVGKLKLHVRQHTGERPYVCPFANCTWTFASASKLTRHMRKHTGDRRYVCPEAGCKKKFMRPEHLKGHMVVHSGGRPFECPHEGCSKRFAAKSSLYVHLKKHMAGNAGTKSAKSAPREKLVYPCPMGACSKRYHAKGSLRQHILMCHSILLAESCTEEAADACQGSDEMAGIVEDSEQEFILPLSLDDAMVAEVLAAGNGSVASVLPNFVLPEATDAEIGVDEALLATSPDVPQVQTTQAQSGTDSQLCAVLDAPVSIASLLTEDLETVSSSRVLQENHSGSARTDYCSNHLYNGQAKKRSAALLGLSSASGSKKTEPSNGVALSCADVILTSSAVREPSASVGLIIPDDPSPGSNIYSDHILSSVPELSGPVTTLLAEHTSSSEISTTIRLQDLD